jgi:hypothetical protein
VCGDPAGGMSHDLPGVVHSMEGLLAYTYGCCRSNRRRASRLLQVVAGYCFAVQQQGVTAFVVFMVLIVAASSWLVVEPGCPCSEPAGGVSDPVLTSMEVTQVALLAG